MPNRLCGWAYKQTLVSYWRVGQYCPSGRSPDQNRPVEARVEEVIGKWCSLLLTGVGGTEYAARSFLPCKWPQMVAQPLTLLDSKIDWIDKLRILDIFYLMDGPNITNVLDNAKVRLRDIPSHLLDMPVLLDHIYGVYCGYTHLFSPPPSPSQIV